MAEFNVGALVVRKESYRYGTWERECALNDRSTDDIFTVDASMELSGRVGLVGLPGSWDASCFRLATSLEEHQDSALSAEDRLRESDAHIECLRELLDIEKRRVSGLQAEVARCCGTVADKAVMEDKIAKLLKLNNELSDKLYEANEQLGRTARHSDDIAVDVFGRHMKAKLRECRGRGKGGWEDPSQCPTEYLGQLLVDELAKGGDPIDVANYCMMLYQRGVHDITDLDCNQILELRRELAEVEDQRDAAVAAAKALGEDLRIAREEVRWARFARTHLGGIGDALFNSTSDIDMPHTVSQLRLLAQMCEDNGNGADAALAYNAAQVVELTAKTLSALYEVQDYIPCRFPPMEGPLA